MSGVADQSRFRLRPALLGEFRTERFVNLREPNRSGHGLTADKMRECNWLKPERRCELEFVAHARGGRLRHAIFRRLVG